MPPLLALLVARYDAWLAVPGNESTASLLETGVSHSGDGEPPQRNYSFLAQAIQSAYRFVYRCVI